MANCQRCSFTSTPFFESAILRTKIGARTTNTVGYLDQGSSQVSIAFPLPSTQSLPSALFLPWTHPSPRTQMFGIGKTAEICSDLVHQDVEHLSAHPIDVFAALPLLLKWAEMPLNFRFHATDRAILGLDQLKQFSQQKRWYSRTSAVRAAMTCSSVAFTSGCMSLAKRTGSLSPVHNACSICFPEKPRISLSTADN